MSETPIFKFRLVAENTTEAGKAASANENALIAEALFKQRVESRTTADPPAGATNGQVYLIPSDDASPAPSGAWAGFEDHLAIYYNGWLIVEPVNGPVFYVADEDLSVKYDDTASPPEWVVGGASTFIGQSDTPASYSGQAGKVAKVNSGETRLEFGEAGGALSWTLVDEHDFSDAPASQFVVTGIDAYSELLIIGTDLDAATISSIIAYLSTDGGSTYLTSAGDYHRQATAPGTFDIGGDNDEAFILNGTPQAAGGHCRFVMENMGSAGIRTSWNGRGANDSGNNSFEFGMTAAAAVHDAIKFEHSNATNLNAGSIHVYGR